MAREKPSKSGSASGAPGSGSGSSVLSVGIDPESLCKRIRELEDQLEQETIRSACLVEANAAIRSTLDVMTSIPALDDLLGRVLISITEHLHSPGATFWIYDPEGASLHLTCLGGVVYKDPPDVDGHSVTRRTEIHEQTAASRDAVMAFQHIFIQDAWNRPDLDPETAKWMKATGANGLLLMPMRVAGSVIGAVCIHKPDNQPFPEEQVELAVALVQQAALAMHVSRLAEETKQAIQRQADEIARANDTMRSTMRVMNSIPALDDFLGEVMLAIDASLHACGGTLWLFSPDGVKSCVHLCCRDGVVTKEIPVLDGFVHVRCFDNPPDLADDNTRNEPTHNLDIADHAFLDEGTRGWLQTNGTVSLHNFPLTIAGVVLGRLCVHWPTNEPLTTTQQELTMALLQPASMAIHVSRMAEEAKEAALALERAEQSKAAAIRYEQEQAARQRAAELARANQAIRETLMAMAAQPELSRFLESVLLTVNRYIPVPGVALWLYNGQTEEMELFRMVIADKMLAPSEIEIREGEEFRRSYRSHCNHKRTLGGEAYFTPDLPDHPEIDARSGAWLRRNRVRGLLSVPLDLGEEVIGTFALHKEDNVPFSEPQVELATVLAQQAALAIHITRLADEAKQAAIAREQEEAARQRAAELARANRVLRETTATLVDQPDLSSFLEQVLLAINRHLNAPGCTLWLRDETTQTENFFAFCHEDTIHRNPPPGGGFLPRISFPIQKSRQEHNYARKPLFIPSAPYSDGIDETTRGWMLHYGSIGLLTVPLVIGQEVVGTIAIHKADNTHYPEEQVELAVALAEQAGLAIHVNRLGEQAKQAAIAIEQEEAATRRAEVLARANAAMTKTVGQLVESSDLRNFVGEVLRVFAVEFDAAGAEFWSYNAANDSFVSALSFEASSGVVAGDENLFETLNKRKVEDDKTGVALSRAGALFYYFDADFEKLPAFRDHLRATGIQTIVNVPMFIREECFGTVALRLTLKRRLDPSEEELAFALAQQLTLALQLTRLAEEAKQAAIGIEQEGAARQRAHELVRANAAIRETLVVMSAQPDLKLFLHSVLKTMHEYLEAPGSTLWLFNEATRSMEFQAMYLGGDVMEDVPLKEGEAWVRSYPWHEEWSATLNGEPQFFPDLPDIATTVKETAVWLRRNGVKAILNVPLAIGQRVLGLFTLHKEDNTPFNGRQVELATVLAQQAALAIHITRLSEEAKQSAIAREQEAAAKHRADELVRANQAIRETLVVMSAQPDIKLFLHSVLKTVHESLEAPGSTLWLFNEASRSMEFQAMYLGGDVMEDVPLEEGEGWTRSYAWSAQWEQTWHGGSEFFPDIPDRPGVDEKTARWLRRNKIKAILQAPLAIGNRVLGVLNLHKEDNTPFSSQQVELANVLAQQAALAMHITRLSEEAKQAAIAIEKEKAAQDRADELVRVNQALRDTLSEMVARPDIESFLDTIILAIHRGLNAPGSTCWLVDPETYTSRLHIMCLGDVVYREPPVLNGHHFCTLCYSPSDAFDEFLAGDPYFVPDLPPSPFIDEGTSLWLKEAGVVGLLTIPLRMGTKLLASISIHKADNEPYPPEQVEFAVALGQQAAMAIHASRLAETAKQAAIAIEQEKAAREQAAELSRANQIIRSTMSVMTSIPALDAFLGQVMITLSTFMNARGGTLWMLSPDLSESRIHICCLDGVVTEEIPDLGGFHHKAGFYTPPEYRHHNLIVEPEQVFDIREHAVIDQQTRGWLKERGVVSLLNIPLNLGESELARICVHLDSNDPVPLAQCEVGMALGQQAALAIHVTRLSDEAKKNAIASTETREREKAAQEQAAELVRANAALRETLADMSAQDDIKLFLGSVLRTAHEYLAAPASTLWLHNEMGGTMHFEVMLLGDEMVRDLRQFGTDCFKSCYPWSPSNERVVLGEATFVLDGPDEPHLDEGTRAWLLHHGLRAYLNVPLVLGGRILGVFGLHKEDNQPFSEAQVELATTLAQQAALAIHMTRLAEETRQVAVSKERELAALLRAAEVEQVSLALQSTLDALASKPSLNTVVEETLKTATIHLQAYSATVWLFDPIAQANSLLLSYDSLSFHWAAEEESSLLSLPVAEWAEWPQFVAARSPQVIEFNEHLTHADKIGGTSWMSGVRTVVLVPLCLGDAVLGLFGINRADLRPWSASDLALAHSFGHQLTLALRLMRLSEQAQFSAQVAATAQERARIAAELHDGLQQLLLASQLWLRRVRDGKGEEKNKAIDMLDELLQQLVLEARRTITTLRPTPNESESNPLTEQFKRLCRHVTSDHLTCSVKSDLSTQLPPAVEDELYRIGQEAVTNVLKHAKANRIDVRLEETTNTITLSIADDGVGMSRANSLGMGLQSMASRAKLIGAELAIGHSDAGGVSVKVTLPASMLVQSAAERSR